MADRKISELSALAAGGQANDDLLTIVDVSEAAAADKNKKITLQNFFKGIPSAVCIGTTTVGNSLADNLTVDNSTSITNNCGITIRCGTAGEGAIYFSDGTSGSAETRGKVVYDHGGDYMQFSTLSNERLRITSEGNLGIGITTPGAGLHISDATEASIRLTNNTGVVGDLTNIGWKFQGLASNAASNANGLSILSDTTERLSISTAGDVTIDGDLTNNATRAQGENGYRFGNAATHVLSRAVGASSTVLDVYGNVGRFRLMGDGDAQNTNNSYGAISDVKLKENIVDANSQWDDIKAVQVRNYSFKAETQNSTHTQIGVIAQELETVCPGLVKDNIDEDADGNELETVTKTVSYSVLYMKAVKALQEAMIRIEALETKVAALEAE